MALVNDAKKKEQRNQVTIKGWLSLLVLCVMLSGVLKDVDGPLKAFDFINMTGSFGQIAGMGTFTGAGGSGAREGLMQALTLFPAICLAVGLIDVATELGAMKAAEKFFNPILQPLIGIPGSCGIAFVASFTTSDVGAVMTRELYRTGQITDSQRTIFASYQYAASGVILNTINTQAPLLPIVLFAVGPIILLLFICKVMGANVVRLCLYLQEHRRGH